ncbi:GNAT family N-acetyltransferase [Roseomonas genomospecies 6]|uniref:N-acetyltransferase n=1 Tax=Roseomonas genomospecies 6 TaxID=214106 RepID=A0A9W7NN43_9PROT|nr:GNAT family N-acetyltransferase [Roseomonas genomospecies 6]KAA0683461.1 N-acetyltransferase [Roseomonas genomospecies 6]
MTTPAILTSFRLILRPWRDGDGDAFHALSRNPTVMEHLLPLPDRAACDAVIARIGEHFDRNGFGFWAVERPGHSPFIGLVGLARVTWEAPFAPAVEVGWRLDPAHWGQGLATEAAGLALSYGFDTVGLTDIVAFTVPANRRSQRVMERLGMERDTAGDFDHPWVPDGHRLKRHVLYRIGRERWRAGLDAGISGRG